MGPSSRRSQVGLVAWMLVAIALVTALAWGDEQREAGAALQDLESEQSVLASSLAADLQAHLTTLQRDALLISEHGPSGFEARYADVRVRAPGAPALTTKDLKRVIVTVPLASDRLVDLSVSPEDLVDRARRVHAEGTIVLLAPPQQTALRSLDGRTVTSVPLRDAIDRAVGTVRLSRPEAAEVGLPARTAMAGIGSVDAGDLGRWGVVAIASAARERDREKRAEWRLVLGVLVASGLVIAFGGAALRRQRKELELQQELAVAEAQRVRDEELRRAERVATMGTFALGVAHEVATPLGVIVGRAEQLARGPRDDRDERDDRVARNAQAILKQADRIQTIVRRFLDMARGRPPSLQRIDPAKVAQGAVAAVEHRFAKAGVALRLDVGAPMPLPVQCDRDMLEHAIVNLLLNACEACKSGGHVELVVRSSGTQMAFVVTDDGAGISSEAAARAAEPFFTTKGMGEGTGLGLAIATEIAKTHRGELVIAPNEGGKGTRARIEIPVAPAAHGPPPASASRA